MDRREGESSHGVRVRPCRHGLMAYLANDEYVGRSLEHYGEFSQAEVHLLCEMVSPGDVIVDAGANVGNHTVPLARRVGAGGRVLAFEPQRPLFLLLCANVAINGLWQVRPEHAALADSAGTILAPELDLEQRANFSGLGLGQWKEGEPVAAVCLDDQELLRCDLIKVDVEGMELEVLEGAAKTIARHRPILYVENDREEHASALIEHLLGLDYDLYWHLPPLFNPKNFRGQATDIFGGLVSVNMLALPGPPPAGLSEEIRSLRPVRSPADRVL